MDLDHDEDACEEGECDRVREDGAEDSADGGAVGPSGGGDAGDEAAGSARRGQKVGRASKRPMGIAATRAKTPIPPNGISFWDQSMGSAEGGVRRLEIGGRKTERGRGGNTEAEGEAGGELSGGRRESEAEEGAAKKGKKERGDAVARETRERTRMNLDPHKAGRKNAQKLQNRSGVRKNVIR